VIGGPASDSECQLARDRGPLVVAGASRVLDDQRLSAVTEGLHANPSDETAVTTTALLARTLLRWRQQLLAIGAAALREHRIEETELAANAVLLTTGEWNTHPEVGAAYLLLGRAAKLRNNLGAALDSFEAAINLTRGRDAVLAGNALDSLGLLLAELGRPDDALDAFREALEVEPTPDGRISIIANRDMLLLQLGEYNAAVASLHDVVKTLEASGAEPTRLAVALDNLAVAYGRSDNDQAALAALDRARDLLRDSDLPIDRARNQMSRWGVLHRLGDDRAHDAFVDAYNLTAEARSLTNLTHYTEEFLTFLDAAVQVAHAQILAELGDEAAADAEHLRLMEAGQAVLQRGLDALHRDQWETADGWLAEAEELCARAGAADGLATAVANRATLRMDSGSVGDAISFVQRTHALAGQLGDARHEMSALSNLASLSLNGADVAGSIGPLDLLLQASALEQALPAIADGLGLEGQERAGYLWGNGGIDDMLARYCDDHDAPDLAEPHWQRTLAAARGFGADPGSRFRLANRLANRLLTLPDDDPLGSVPALVAELESVVAENRDLLRVQVVAHRALGMHCVPGDPHAAIDHLEAAASAQSRLAAQVSPHERPGVIAASPVPYSTLAQLLAAAGDTARGWAALQGDKGRRVLEAVGDDRPPDLAAVERSLTGLDEHAVIVDVAMVRSGIMAFLVGQGTCTALHPISTPTRWLEHAFKGDVGERDARVVEACLHDPTLATFIAAIDSRLPPGASVLLVPAGPLDNLPLDLVPIGGRPWGASRSISLLPAAGLVTAFAGATGSRPTHSLVAGDSDGTLPGAEQECIEVAAALATEPLLGPDCTFEAVASALSGDRLDIIHLAVHGRGDSTRGGRAALRFAAPGSATWVPFDELLALGLNAELVVLSGCSTALSGPVHGQGAVSAAQAAIEAGAGAVIGCLWPVEDQAAATFATALYKALVPAWSAGPADLRQAMASARQAVQGVPASMAPDRIAVRRDGRRNLSPEPTAAADPAVGDALRWAPFVLVGDPVLAG
jgi:tetratricopeptide (TPR) repeat protein